MAASVEDIKAMLDPMTIEGIRDLLKAANDEGTITVRKAVDGIIEDTRRTEQQKKKAVVDIVVLLFTMPAGAAAPEAETKVRSVSPSSSSASSEEKSDPDEERRRNSKIYRKKERRERRTAASGLSQPERVVRPMSTSKPRPSWPASSSSRPKAASSTSSSSSSSMSVECSPVTSKPKRKRVKSSSNSDATVVESGRKGPPFKQSKVITISDSDSDENGEKTDDELSRRRAAGKAEADKKTEKGREFKEKIQEKKSYEDKTSSHSKYKDNQESSSTSRDKNNPKASKHDAKANFRRSDQKSSVRDKERHRDKEKKHSEMDKSQERDKHRGRDKDEPRSKYREKDRNRERGKHGGQEECGKQHNEKGMDKSRAADKVPQTDYDADDLDESNLQDVKTEKFLLNQAGVAEVRQDSSRSKINDASVGKEQQPDQNQPVTSTTDEAGKKQPSPLRSRPASDSVSSSVKITSTQDQMPDDVVMMTVEDTTNHQKTPEQITSDSRKDDRQQEEFKEVKEPEKLQKKDFTTDPDFLKYQKKFNLKVFKIELQDIKKQERYHWSEGDQVYRDWKKTQKEKRKQAQVQGHAQRHKFEKYGKSTVKKPGEGLKRPTKESLTFKDKRFEALHKKIPKREKKVDVLGIVFAGISKPLWDCRIPKDQAATLTIKPPAAGLQPAIEPDRVKFETRKEKDTWKPSEEELFLLDGQPKPRDNIPAAAGAPPVPLSDTEQEPEVIWDGGDDVQMDYNEYDRRGNVIDRRRKDDDDEPAYSSDESEPADAHIPCMVPKCGPHANAVYDFMTNHPVEIIPPDLYLDPADDKKTTDPTHDVTTEQFLQRTSKWFRKQEHESYFQRAPSLPENKEEEFYMLMLNDDGDDEDMSWSGNVSNPDGDDLQDTEISSTALDADQEDEYCGAALLNAKLRISKGEAPDCFAPIFTLPRGCNYDKKNFQATCNLCSEKLYDKRQLGVHLRGSTHRANILNSSLKLADPNQKIAVKFREEFQIEMASKMGAESSKTKDKESQVKSSKDSKDTPKADTERKHDKDKSQSKSAKESKSKTDLKDQDAKKDDKGKGSVKRDRDRRRSSSRGRNRSRSRSPAKRARSSHHRKSRSRSRSGDRGRRSRSRHHRRSRSRSPRNSKRTSDSHSHSRKIDEFLARNEKKSGRRSSPGARSPKASNNAKRDEDLIFQEKLALQAKGIWTEELEGRWKLMEDDKERLKKFVALKKKTLEEKPEEHPQYTQEWNRFWERRYQELVDKGKDADSHDYTTEWKQVWSGIAERLLMKEHDDKLIEARVKFGVDLASLKKLNAQAPRVPTNVLHQPSNVGYGPNTGYVPPGMQQMPGPGFSSGPIMPGPMNNGQFYPNGGPYQPAIVPVDPFNGMHLAGPMMQTPVGHCFVTTVPMVAPVHSNEAPTLNSAFGMREQPQSVRPNPPSGGSGPVSAPTPVPAAAKPDVNYSPQAMSISSGGSGNTSTSKPIGVTDVLSQWNSITGLNPNAEKASKPQSATSVTSGSSLPPYDYENVTVTQTLKSILELEDYLSFLAGPMKRYYDKAVEHEAMQKDSSFQLLKDKDFVQLLFQARDKFFTSMKARCGTQDVRKKLNEVMFMLNILLDSPQCQKFQPSVNEVPAQGPAGTTLGPSTSQTPIVASKNTQQAKQTSPEVQVIAQSQQAIAKAVEGLDFAQKKRMSQVISSSFLAQGKDRWKEAELMKGIAAVVKPITADIQRSRTSPEIVMEKLKRKQAPLPPRVAPPRRVAPPQDNNYRQPPPPQQFHNRPQPHGVRPDYGGPRGYGPSTGSYPGYLPPHQPLWTRAAPQPPRAPYRGTPAADMFVPNPLARRGGGGGRFMGNPTTEEVQCPADVDNHEQLEHEPHSQALSAEEVPTPEELQSVVVDSPACSVSEGEVEDNTDVSENGDEPSQEQDGEEQKKSADLSHLPPAIRMLIMKEKQGDLPNIRVEKENPRRRRQKKSESGDRNEKKRRRRKKVERSKSQDSLYDRQRNRHEHNRRPRDRHVKPHRRHTEDVRRHSDSGSEAGQGHGRRRHHESFKKSERRVSAVAGVSANFWNEANQEETFIEHELVRSEAGDIRRGVQQMDPISEDEISLAEEVSPVEALPEAELISEDETEEMAFDTISDLGQPEVEKIKFGAEAIVCTQPSCVEDGELISDGEL